MRPAPSRRLAAIALALVFGLAACGKETGDDDKGEDEAHERAEEELTAFEVEHGIGPVKEAITLGPVDPAMAGRGKATFEGKCSACHKLDTTYVGPALGEVTGRRTPAFVMNMILNPQEMVERHPVAKQMLAERMTFMANQGLTVTEAREVVEYLRTQSKSAPRQ
ncbi:MAG: c-type cytochrome [Gemmatimonadales bacterium]|nr:c-type cytochrome [Gemmatimonadales bacterium]